SEQLPVRAFGPADGFPSKSVEGITKDSRGFLWFATREGLAQFDGYEFHTYGKENGLPRDAISDFLETGSGTPWAATSGGLARFDPTAPASRKFVVNRADPASSRPVYALYEDPGGQVWAGTADGLFRHARGSGQAREETRTGAAPTPRRQS